MGLLGKIWSKKKILGPDSASVVVKMQEAEMVRTHQEKNDPVRRC